MKIFIKIYIYIYIYIFVNVYFGRYFMKLYLYRNKDDLRNFQNKKVLFLNLKDFIFYKYICKMYTSADM